MIVAEEWSAPENEENENLPPSGIHTDTDESEVKRTQQSGCISRKPELLQFCLCSYCYDKDLNRYLDDGQGRVL